MSPTVGHKPNSACGRKVDNVKFFVVVKVGALGIYKRVPREFRAAIGQEYELEEVGPSCVATSYDTLLDRDFVRWLALWLCHCAHSWRNRPGNTLCHHDRENCCGARDYLAVRH